MKVVAGARGGLVAISFVELPAETTVCTFHVCSYLVVTFFVRFIVVMTSNSSTVYTGFILALPIYL